MRTFIANVRLVRLTKAVNDLLTELLLFDAPNRLTDRLQNTA